jgi:phosphatidylserine decarboxylase
VEAGMRLLSGQRLGIMKFGSRIDLFIPVTATICVSEGQSVRAGETVVAKFSRSDDLDGVTTVR